MRLTIRPLEHYFELVWDLRRRYALRVKRQLSEVAAHGLNADHNPLDPRYNGKAIAKS
jgi:hypothetical protein